ncbi:MAG: hypothetical protein ED559_05730 [Phycisphaera sp.]|nr:MAG: hypothetical protein ED559_05730 [Phycisphaera sp.]
MTHAALIAALMLIAPSQQPELKPVEEGFEDVSPLASPNRLEPIDLRRPTGFEQVYEITTPTGEKAFVRIDNGLVAIFDRSDYLAGTDRAFIPPNTRFKIGTQGLTARSDQTIETTPASGRIDRRVSNRVPNRPAGFRPAQQRAEQAQESEEEGDRNVAAVEGPPSIVTNEIYRRLRLTQLLLDAIEKP